MVELITYIDNSIKNCVTEVKQFGLCHLILSDNEKFPATIESEATKVVPDDRFEIITYHRLLNGNYEYREDLSFGKKSTNSNKQRVRMVVFMKLDADQNRIDDIFNVIPEGFDLDGYTNIFTLQTATGIIRDRATIWSDEYGDAYKDKYQQVWQVYAIEYDLNYIKCNVCV